LQGEERISERKLEGVHVSLLSNALRAALVSAAGLLVLACAALPSVGSRWKEEVKLHDGRTILVRRSQNYHGLSEPTQPAPVGEHTLTFRPPGADRDISWRGEYGEDVGRMELSPLALDVIGGVPYLIAWPNLCIAYNKWGRPNPPYVAFRFEAGTWKRIPLSAIPAEIGKANLGLRITQADAARWQSMDVVPWATIERENASSVVLERKIIRREALPTSARDSVVNNNNCPEMIPDGRGGWVGLDTFTRRSSLAECRRVCDLSRMTPPACPCDRLFERK
jgi:hypothetical protein